MKNLSIFKAYKNKSSIKLFDYSENTHIFQGFLFADNNNKSLKDLHLTYTRQKTKDVEIAN